MKLVVLMCLIAAVCELSLRAAEWVREAKELLHPEEPIIVDIHDADVVEMLNNNNPFGGLR